MEEFFENNIKVFLEKSLEVLTNFALFPSFTGWLLVIKIVFILLFLASLVLVIILLLKTSWLKYRYLEDAAEILTFKPFGARKIEKEWKKIMFHLTKKLDSEYKLAIIEADNLLEDILKNLGYQGKSLGERLDQLNEITLPNLAKVREAHQVRNNIIHDPNYVLSLEETKKVLAIFEKAFQDLEVF